MAKLTLKENESRATRLLKAHGHTSPPVDVELLADQLGIRIQREDLDDEISGVLVCKSGASVIAINKKHSAVRQRFTIAHEIAHFHLHHSGRKEAVFVDRAAVHFRNQVSSAGIDVHEVEANNFAAAILMPKIMLEDDLGRIDEALSGVHVMRLAAKYRVSEQAMSIRLARLDFVSYI
jgi:Zn-dependent peptidase ImmA (M78 family)